MVVQSLMRKDFLSRQTMISALADRVVNVLSDALEEHGRASLVVSGGTTPSLLFDELSDRELDWPNVTVTLADERWVNQDHDDSNAKLVSKHFLRGCAAKANFIGLYTGDATPDAGLSKLEKRLASISRPFDVVLLGMGNDGHTASLFPDGDTLEACLDHQDSRSCMGLNAPGASQPRMTLTLSALLDAREIDVLLMGQSKRDVLEAAMSGGPLGEMPIRAVLHQKLTPVTIWWAS